MDGGAITTTSTGGGITFGAAGALDSTSAVALTANVGATIDALQLINPSNTAGDVTFVATTGSVLVPDPPTAAVQARGGTIRMTTDAGSLSVSSAATTGNGSVELIAKGASSDLSVGSISAGAAVTVWAPQGTQSPAGNLAQSASSFQITQTSFPANDPPLVPALYGAPFGATSGEVEALANQALGLSRASSFQPAPEARLAASDSSNAGHNVLYVDWSSYDPNVSLFGTLNPPVCLPGDQREEDTGSASGCAAPPSQARLGPLSVPTRTAMALTRLGWLTVPSFDPTR